MPRRKLTSEEKRKRRESRDARRAKGFRTKRSQQLAALGHLVQRRQHGNFAVAHINPFKGRSQIAVHHRSAKFGIHPQAHYIYYPKYRYGSERRTAKGRRYFRMRAFRSLGGKHRRLSATKQGKRLRRALRFGQIEVGTKDEVYFGLAKHTSIGLTKDDLKMNPKTGIVVQKAGTKRHPRKARAAGAPKKAKKAKKSGTKRARKAKPAAAGVPIGQDYGRLMNMVRRFTPRVEMPIGMVAAPPKPRSKSRSSSTTAVAHVSPVAVASPVAAASPVIVEAVPHKSRSKSRSINYPVVPYIDILGQAAQHKRKSRSKSKSSPKKKSQSPKKISYSAESKSLYEQWHAIQKRILNANKANRPKLIPIRTGIETKMIDKGLTPPAR